MSELLEFTGTEVGYYFICHKKLWWFAHGMQMEQENERVKMGQFVHHDSYARQKHELNIDDKIVLDWREDGVIHEIKLTDKMEEAHEMQLAYYLYYLKCKGIDGLRGQIDYPKLRKTKVVELTDALESKLVQAFAQMKRVATQLQPPQVNYMKICRSCSYAELCWS